MNCTPLNSLIVAGLCLWAAVVVAEDAEPDWDALEAGFSTSQVNEGELEFLTTRPAGRILKTTNTLTILPASLQDGWVRLAQCQSSLDPVDSITVQYRYTGMRDLKVISASNMDSAWVEGSTVQLRGVRQGGEVCIEAAVQVLKDDGAGGFSLRSGPFHRRFLDGYYPVELVYRITWPPEQLALREARPASVPGLALHSGPGELAIDALFEGKLVVELSFGRL